MHDSSSSYTKKCHFPTFKAALDCLGNGSRVSEEAVQLLQLQPWTATPISAPSSFAGLQTACLTHTYLCDFSIAEAGRLKADKITTLSCIVMQVSTLRTAWNAS